MGADHIVWAGGADLALSELEGQFWGMAPRQSKAVHVVKMSSIYR